MRRFLLSSRARRESHLKLPTDDDSMARAALALAVVVGAYALWLSLDWGVRNDLPLLMYPAGLAMRGERVPFLEIVDMNQPVSYLVYGLLDWLVGPNDAVLRAFDVAAVLFVGWYASEAIRAPARIVGLATTALFAAWHIHDAGVDALQRELLVLVLLVSSGVALARWRPLVAGLLAGLAPLVKIHAFPLFVVVLLLHLVPMRPRARWQTLRRYAAGGAIAIGCVLAWLGAIGGLAAWWGIVTQYVPLYGQQAGTMFFVASAGERWEIVRRFALDERVHATTALLPIAVWLVLRTRFGKHHAWGHVAVGSAVLWAAGWIYVLPPGVFWLYHQTFAYFFGAAMVATVFAIPRDATRAWRVELGAVRFLALYLAWPLYSWPLEHIAAQDGRDGRNRHALGVEQFLSAHVTEGETVQPLDVAEGAIDGMWRADVELASPFLYEFMFYHHVTTPVVRELRARFLAQLEGDHPPDWIVRADRRHRMRPGGHGTEARFDALERLIDERYALVSTDGVFEYHRLEQRATAPPATDGSAPTR